MNVLIKTLLTFVFYKKPAKRLSRKVSKNVQVLFKAESNTDERNFTNHMIQEKPIQLYRNCIIHMFLTYYTGSWILYPKPDSVVPALCTILASQYFSYT